MKKTSIKILRLLLGSLAFMLWASLSADAAYVGPSLHRELGKSDATRGIPVIVRMHDPIVANTLAIQTRRKGILRAQGRANLIQALKSHAKRKRQPLQAVLNRHGIHQVRHLWLINGEAFVATPAQIEEIAQLPEVASITTDAVIEVPKTIPSQVSGPTETNISLINAPDLWSKGYYGQGVTVAVMDTGVDINHPDLGPQWRGGDNSWYDPNGEHLYTPHDSDGHGTNVTGLVLGGNSAGTYIGVAPDAQWIGVKIFDDVGVASISVIHAGFQWLLDPDGNPQTDDAPDIVNNSWGFESEAGLCNALSREFQADVQALKAAGIAVVFSAGNTGPSPLSSVAPANYPESFAVGSVGTLASATEISEFSARGPSACDGSIYPEVVAPGSSVKTGDLTAGGIFPNSYTFVSGTSFAAPHVSGAMALLLGAFPETPVSILEAAVTLSAVELGDIGIDNTYGYGLVDVLSAYQHLDTQVFVDGRLLLPNGGEFLTGLSTTDIQWVAHPDAGTYVLRFSRSSGANWTPLATVNATDGTTYSWSVPNINNDTVLIKVAAYNASGQWLAADISDEVFRITKANTVLAPNGGELLVGLSSTGIQWTAHPDAETYVLRFSRSSGANWTPLTTVNATDGTTYSWSVPNINNDTVLIKVAAYNASGQWLAADTSDEVFRITKANTVLAL